MNIASALKITGWMTEQELYFLAESAAKSTLILEVGSYCGRSTRAMADNTRGIIHAIDPWDGKFQIYKGTLLENGDNIKYTIFFNNLLRYIESGQVQVNRMNFLDFKIIDPPNMIFIDAIHEYEAVKKDIYHAMSLMKKGLLCGHDYCDAWHGVIEAVNEIFGNKVNTCGTIWWVEL